MREPKEMSHLRLKCTSQGAPDTFEIKLTLHGCMQPWLSTGCGLTCVSRQDPLWLWGEWGSTSGLLTFLIHSKNKLIGKISKRRAWVLGSLMSFKMDFFQQTCFKWTSSSIPFQYPQSRRMNSLLGVTGRGLEWVARPMFLVKKPLKWLFRTAKKQYNSRL